MRPVHRIGRSLDSRVFYLYYLVAFLLVSAIAFEAYWSNGISFIWDADGLRQHYPAFIYYGNWLRSIWTNLISTGTLSIPTWDLSLGYGNDVITTLQYYVMGDPLNLVSAFVSPEQSALAFSILALLRVFLAGGFFAVYCRHFGFKGYAILTASLVYAFSGYAMYVMLRHPFFVTPLMYLPLICLGVEHILKKRRPILYIVSLALMILSNFYFGYMVCLITFFYVLFRYVMVVGDWHPRVLLPWVGRFLLWSVLALMIASPLLVPNALALVGSLRSSDVIVPLLYRRAYYQQFLPGLTLPVVIGNWTLMGYTFLGFIAVILLFMQRGRAWRWVKVAFVLFLIVLLIPYCGHIANGFSYACNRCCFGFSFLVCALIAALMPRLAKLSVRQWLVLCVASIAYCVACFAFSLSDSQQVWLCGLMTVCVLVSVVLAMPLCMSLKPMRLVSTGIMCVLVLVMVAINARSNASAYYPDMVPMAHAYETVSQSSFKQIASSDTSVYRCDGSGTDLSNEGLVTDTVNYASQYFSVVNRYLSEFFLDDMHIDGNLSGCHLDSDGRAQLMQLANVKYCLAESSVVPAGYAEIGSTGIYRATNALPFGYTYDAQMSEETYGSLDPVQKQEALLQTAVVDGAGSSIPYEAPTTNTSYPTFKETAGKGTVLQASGSVKAKRAGASITLDVDRAAGENLYLYLSDFSYERPSKGADADDQAHTLIVRSGTVQKKVTFYVPGSQFYCGDSSAVVNLGSSGKGSSRITIRFPHKGTYSFSSVKVIEENTAGIDSQVSKLAQEHLTDVSFGCNSISGSIAVSSDKLLCLSIPYSTGWHLKVDGQDVDTLRVNTWMVGAQLSPGKHRIQLEYETPGLRVGLYLAAAALLICLVCGLLWRFRKRPPKRLGASDEESRE